MSGEWIPLTSPQPTTLPQLLQANGLASDNATLTNIWSAAENMGNHRAQVRPPHNVLAGETWYVPPPPMPMDAVLSTYTCTGSERSTDEIVQAIRALHGEAAEEQLTVARDAFTTDYLLGLAYNQRYRIRRLASPPVAIAAGETLRYYTRRRRTRTHDVAPSTGVQRSTNSIPADDGPFIVRIELERPDQKMKILNMIPEAETVNPRDPNAALAAEWRPASGRVRFKVTITARTGSVTPTGATIRVRHPGGVYFTEERTDSDWTRTGERIWEWDGFTTPPPASGASDLGEADTRILRGRLTVEIVVMSASAGYSIGWLELANRPHKAGFVDVKARLGAGDIEAFAYVSFQHASRDGGVWAATVIGSLLAGALAVGAVAIARRVDADDGTPLTPDQERDYGIAMGVAGGATAAAFLGIVGAILAASTLSEADFNTFRGQIMNGIGSHFSRSVTIGGRSFTFRASAQTTGGNDRVRYALTTAAIRDRACNLTPVPLVGMIFIPYLPTNALWNTEVAAHEFGHSIMLQTGGTGWSMTHKGSSGGVGGLDVVRGPRGFARNSGDYDDLMIYYDEQQAGAPGWNPGNVRAAVVEVLGWIESTQIEFRAM
ncbi:MAG: hypothetical protein U0271_08230 [Polyangiaceae bacterium]